MDFAMYCLLYVVLIVSYVAVIKYMAEKPVDDAVDHGPQTRQSGSAVAAVAAGRN